MNYKGAWCDVAPDADTFVINIGDMMMRMTDDKWQSTLHRVVGCRSQVRNTVTGLSLRTAFCVR